MKNNQNPFISIIVATKNVEKTILRLINSVKIQSSSSVELIIVDGLSKDRTVEIINDNIDVVSEFLSETDNGISDAWNKGINLSKGKWLLFLGGDDLLYDNNVIEKSIKILKDLEKTIMIAYGQIVMIDQNEKYINKMGEKWDNVKHMNATQMTIPHQGIFHKRQLFFEIGHYDIDFPYAGDYELLLRSLKLNNPYFLKNLIVTKMSIGGFSSDPEMQWNHVYEFRKARIKNNINTFNLLWFWIFIKSLVKMIIIKTLGNIIYNKIYKFIMNFEIKIKK